MDTGSDQHISFYLLNSSIQIKSLKPRNVEKSRNDTLDACVLITCVIFSYTRTYIINANQATARYFKAKHALIRNKANTAINIST